MRTVCDFVNIPSFPLYQSTTHTFIALLSEGFYSIIIVIIIIEVIAAVCLYRNVGDLECFEISSFYNIELRSQRAIKRQILKMGFYMLTQSLLLLLLLLSVFINASRLIYTLHIHLVFGLFIQVFCDECWLSHFRFLWLYLCLTSGLINQRNQIGKEFRSINRKTIIINK